jgi:capsid assembly protease
MQFDPMEPMALLPSYASEFVRAMMAESHSMPTVKAAMPQPYLTDGMSRAEISSAAKGNMLAVVPLWGVLSPSGYGGTSLDEFTRTIRMLDANTNVSDIVLNITSPGGTVVGTPEAADAVRRVRDNGQTRITAVANGMMASAATWIGTAASEVVVTPSGEAGSIGVISMYANASKYYEAMGVEIDVMRVPEKKARFSGVEPMTDEMRQLVELRIGQSYERFKRAMADNRSVRIDQVESKFGGGEMLSAVEAKESGLVDRIATLDDTIARLAKRRAPSSARLALAKAQIENN